jgi:hypothetical protein
VTPLGRALAERIKAEGPLSVEAYMEACNAYYYATRDPLGAGGDFTTAPEIHQMFGEIVGAFILFYGVFRFGIEFIREPDAQLTAFAQATGLHMGQWLTVPMILGGIYLMATAKGRRERIEPTAGTASVA